jgi:hypothetical protein
LPACWTKRAQRARGLDLRRRFRLFRRGSAALTAYLCGHKERERKQKQTQ